MGCTCWGWSLIIRPCFHLRWYSLRPSLNRRKWYFWAKPSTSKINELRLSITISLSLCVNLYTIKLMFRIRSICRRHVSYIIIKDTQGSLIMYFNYTLYVYANIFFIVQCWFWGRGQLVFWGASKFSNLLAPRATASTSLMSRPAEHGKTSPTIARLMQSSTAINGRWCHIRWCDRNAVDHRRYDVSRI